MNLDYCSINAQAPTDLIRPSLKTGSAVVATWYACLWIDGYTVTEQPWSYYCSIYNHAQWFSHIANENYTIRSKQDQGWVSMVMWLVTPRPPSRCKGHRCMCLGWPVKTSDRVMKDENYAKFEYVRTFCLLLNREKCQLIISVILLCVYYKNKYYTKSHANFCYNCHAKCN